MTAVATPASQYRWQCNPAALTCRSSRPTKPLGRSQTRGVRRRGLDGMTKQAPLIWFHISVVVLEVVEVPRPDAELISGDLRVEVLQLRLRLAIDLDETGHIWSATAP